MLPDRVSNPGPLTYESGALPTALCGPAIFDSPGELFTYKLYTLKCLSPLKVSVSA